MDGESQASPSENPNRPSTEEVKQAVLNASKEHCSKNYRNTPFQLTFAYECLSDELPLHELRWDEVEGLIDEVFELSCERCIQEIVQEQDEEDMWHDSDVCSAIENLRKYPNKLSAVWEFLEQPDGPRNAGPRSALAVAVLRAEHGRASNDDCSLIRRKIEVESIEECESSSGPTFAVFGSLSNTNDEQRAALVALAVRLVFSDAVTSTGYKSSIVTQLRDYGSSARGALITILEQHASPEVRGSAATALGFASIDDNRVRSALRAALSDEGITYSGEEIGGFSGPIQYVKNAAEKAFGELDKSNPVIFSAFAERFRCVGVSSDRSFSAPDCPNWNENRYTIQRDGKYEIGLSYSPLDQRSRQKYGEDDPISAFELLAIHVNGKSARNNYAVVDHYYGVHWHDLVRIEADLRTGDTVSIREVDVNGMHCLLWHAAFYVSELEDV